MVAPLPSQYMKISAAYGATSTTNWKTCGTHTGVDYAAPIGTPVFATVDGVVHHRFYGRAFGDRCVGLVAADGSGEAFYAHLDSRVPHGTRVRAGDRVGRSGNRGLSTGPHLHYEWLKVPGTWNCGNIRNPMPSIEGGGGWMFPAGSKVFRSKVGFDGHESNADRESDSIKMIQEMLKRHGVGDAAKTLPATGKYWTQTDEAVRADQRAHGFGNDPERGSYVGPRQFAHLVQATGAPYVWVDDGPPAVEGKPEPKPEPEPEPKPDPERPVSNKWHVAPSLLHLRNEVDVEWPDRSKASDGTIGDYEHSKSKSEHNPVGHPFGPQYGTPGAVHAIDITAKGIDADRVLKAAIGDPRVWYVIHRSRIWSKTYDWAERPYNGSNPHDTHIHISLAADDNISARVNEANTDTWLHKTDPDPEPPVEGGGNVIDLVVRLRVKVAQDGSAEVLSTGAEVA